jgi:uncharacterized protein (DUF305 family)
MQTLPRPPAGPYADAHARPKQDGAWLVALRRFLMFVAVASLAWELGHLPLYTIWSEGRVSEILFAVTHCTGGDVLIAGASLILALLLAGDPAWPSQKYRSVAALTLAFGIAYTAFSEWLNTTVRRSWAYSDLMPLVTWLDIGLSPIAQWIVIPIAAFWWARRPFLAPDRRVGWRDGRDPGGVKRRGRRGPFLPSTGTFHMEAGMAPEGGGRRNRDERVSMRIPKTIIAAAVLVGLSGVSWAREYEPDEGTEGHVPAVAYETFMLAPGERIDPATIRADLDYTAGMRRHHEGAVTMSGEYLQDPRGTNPILRELAHAIIVNQRFEIAVLDEIRRSVEKEPETVADLGLVRIVRREIGVDGLEHQRQFVKRLPPGFLDLALAPGLEASERDVKFAKEMMIHHEAALDMARRYNADPEATNLIIRRLNLDIIVDQAYEIGFLERMVERFPGDPDTVEIDSSIPGMMHMPMDDGHESVEGMDHGTRH